MDEQRCFHCGLKVVTAPTGIPVITDPTTGAWQCVARPGEGHEITHPGRSQR